MGCPCETTLCKMAKLKHELQAAPAYTYYFTWQSPILDGLPGPGILPSCNSASTTRSAANKEPAIHQKPSYLRRRWLPPGALSQRTASPAYPASAWEPSDPETNRTMLWDNDCRMVNDPEGEARKIILS